MKKPATGRAAVPAKKAAAPKKAAPKKPAAKKPSPAAAAAHKAHLARLAHLAHLGLGPKAAPKKKRQLALGNGVACCSAEALAASLRLIGRPVSDTDVLALYRRTASDPDTGASILATLEAAAGFGLRGVRLGDFRMEELQHDSVAEGVPVVDGAVHDERFQVGQFLAAPGLVALHGASLILGLELPGPHAVLATPDGWWSWGDLYDPARWPDAVIEEAWAITWA